MAFVYVLLGWVVERKLANPQSKVKAFFRILCSPVTALVARLVPAGTEYRRVISIALLGIGGVWIGLIVLTEVLRRT